MDRWMDTETDEHNSQTAGQALRRFVTLASPLEEEDEEDPRFLSMQQGKGRLLLLAVLARSLFLPSAGTTSKAKQPPARAPSSGFCRARAQVSASSRAAVPEPGPGCTRRSVPQPRLARRKHAHSRGPAGEGRRARRARDHVSLLARKVGWPERRAQGRRERGANSRAEALGGGGHLLLFRTHARPQLLGSRDLLGVEGLRGAQPLLVPGLCLPRPRLRIVPSAAPW